MKISKILILTFVCLTLPAMTSCAGKNGGSKTAKTPSVVDTFRASPDWAKLDGNFKNSWEKAMTAGETDKKFDCFIKTKAKMTKNEKAELKDAGYTLRSSTGRISTGSVAAGSVPKVAALPFVQVMEAAVPVSPKK